MCDDNCLGTVNPSLAREWHPTKNGSLTPRDVTPSSGKKAWWICQKGHEWDTAFISRLRKAPFDISAKEFEEKVLVEHVNIDNYDLLIGHKLAANVLAKLVELRPEISFLPEVTHEKLYWAAKGLFEEKLL